MTTDAVQRELKRGSQLSVIALVGALIEKASKVCSSDIHLEPTLHGLVARLRVDGVLHDAYVFPKEIRSEIISRIKVLSRLRTDEHQMTQDGRFRYDLRDSSFVDVRISIAPTYHGENAVLRLLSNTAENYTLGALGFSVEDTEKITNAIRKPNGMILSTGPTGSGKTTTMYTLIRMLNSRDVSVVTIEDPIEYAVEGIEQIQVNPHAGLTFANGLRTILRQDPNIIMVGEIRDAETASIAVNTALTGHLLLSTLHTNDAATTLPRLLDMHVEAFLVASTIRIAIGQRLVRKICGACREEAPITAKVAKYLSASSLRSKVRANNIFFKGKGCDGCNHTGYSGRICLNEVMETNADIQQAILNRAPAAELKKIAIKNGMTPMLEDGFQKARTGVTTLEEVLRVVND